MLCTPTNFYEDVSNGFLLLVSDHFTMWISIGCGSHLGFSISIKFNTNLPLDMLNTTTKIYEDISNGFLVMLLNVVSQFEISISCGHHLGFPISLKFNPNLHVDLLNTPTKFHKDISNGFPFIGRTSFHNVKFQLTVVAILDFRFHSNSIPNYLLTCLTHPPSFMKISQTVFLLLVGRRFTMWNFSRLWRPSWNSDFTQIQSQPASWYA